MSTILAIETSSELASCALLRGAAVTHRDASGVRTHSQSILPMVQSLLAEAGITLADCDAIAFGSGPGSFTGVRTACGVAQGLAFGASLPVVPVVTLEAMALACHQRATATATATATANAATTATTATATTVTAAAAGPVEVLAVLDARMGEVYSAQYRFSDAAALAPAIVLAPALSAPQALAVLAPPPGTPLLACGNGLSAYASDFAASGFAAAGQPDVMPHAIQVAQLARLALAAGQFVTAAEAQPLYLRNKIAFTSAERVEIQAAKVAAAAAVETLP